MDELRNRKGTNFPIFGVVSFDLTLTDGTTKHLDPDGGLVWASPVEEAPQEHYEDARSQAIRCRKCGSTAIHPTEYYADNWFDPKCDDCGFVSRSDYLSDYRPYIAPGQPGSHDKPDDYEPWEGEQDGTL